MKEYEFREMLKNHIDSMAESVDCFDKIAERAYAKNDTVRVKDDGHTVSGVENITGRRQFRLFPVVALAVAFCLCVGFILPIAFFQSKPAVEEQATQMEQRFRSLYNELSCELEAFDYSIEDYSLNEFNASSLFINPLNVYQFKNNSGENDAYIRVYIKTVNGDGISVPTNQMYLVKHTGCEENMSIPPKESILEIVDTKAKITAKELSSLIYEKADPSDIENRIAIESGWDESDGSYGEEEINYLDDTLSLAMPTIVSNNFKPDGTGRLLYNEKAANVAEFEYYSIYKSKSADGIHALISSVLYYNLADIVGSNVAYNYYIKSMCGDGGVFSEFDGIDYDNCWNTAAVNRKADMTKNIAMKVDAYSYVKADKPFFTRQDIIGENLPVGDVQINLTGGLPQNKETISAFNEYLEKNLLNFRIRITDNERLISDVAIPINAYGDTFTVYVDAENLYNIDAPSEYVNNENNIRKKYGIEFNRNRNDVLIRGRD